MKVPYNYLPMQFSDVEEIFKDWRELIQTTEFTLGPFVERFEESFADFVGCKHVISTNNGTDALILGLKALGVGPGDEVISVSSTFYATIGAIVAVGAKPVFVDIDERYQMDPTKIEAVITHKTKVILPVHWGGAPPDMVKIIKIAKDNGLKILSDACMAPGGLINGKQSGSFGDVSAWSMHPLKPLNVMGDGGMVSTDNDELADWMRMYRNHGMVDRDHNDIWGVNMRLQPLQAVVAQRVLKTVDETVSIRNQNASVLDEGFRGLSEFVKLPPRPHDYRETFSLYMAQFEKRDDLIEFLNARDIDAKIHYKLPLHLQKAATSLGYKNGDFPKSEEYSNKIMTIPIHQYLSRDQLEYVIKSVHEFYSN